MDEITLNGIEYVLKSKVNQSSKIGIAITTHNRWDLIKKAADHHKKHLPAGSVLIVVDDGSSHPLQPIDGVTVYRNNTAKGISHAKNKCIELLMDAGCDHLFLFDDDCWPVVNGWEKQYIESPEPHLAHSWNLVKLWEDSQHTAFHACGGTVLYYERHVIDKVGGMRHIFGKYGCEHVNLSDRIHNNGLTTWRYADVTGSEKLFYECDRHERNTHKTAANQVDLQHNATKGRELWMTMLDDKSFAPYRQQHDYVITTLLTANPDPQRKAKMTASVAMIDNLAKSIKHGRLVVLHDELQSPSLKTGAGEDVIFVRVESKKNPYFDRWQVIYQWLRSAKNVNRAWVVDGTDVKQLRNPFDIENGKLYVGQEQSTIKSPWLSQNCGAKKLADIISDNPDHTLLNPGTVGADYQTLLSFCHAMVKGYYDDQIETIQGWDKTTLGNFDMGLFQIICRDKFAEKLVYGPSVNTLFKGEKADDFARWQHK